MKNLKLFLVMLSGLALLVLFQNCGAKMSFSGDGQLVAKSDGTEDIDDIDLGDGDGGDEDDGEEEDDSTDDDGEEDDDVVDNGDDDGGEEEDDSTDDVVDTDDGGDGDGGDDDQVIEEDNGETLYACILEGNGDSVRLGYVSDQLSEIGNVAAGEVCTTESACLNIVSQAFNVKHAKKAGFCNGHNPHVHHLNGSQIAALLGDAEASVALASNSEGSSNGKGKKK